MERILAKYSGQITSEMYKDGFRNEKNKEKKTDAGDIPSHAVYINQLRYMLDEVIDNKKIAEDTSLVLKKGTSHRDAYNEREQGKYDISQQVRKTIMLGTGEFKQKDASLPAALASGSESMASGTESMAPGEVLPAFADLMEEEVRARSETLSSFKTKSGEMVTKNAENIPLMHHRNPEPMIQTSENRMPSFMPVGQQSDVRGMHLVSSQKEENGSKSITYAFRRVDESGKTSVDVSLSGSLSNPTATIIPSTAIVREKLDAALNTPDAPSVALKGEEQKEQQQNKNHHDLLDEEEV